MTPTARLHQVLKVTLWEKLIDNPRNHCNAFTELQCQNTRAVLERSFKKHENRKMWCILFRLKLTTYLVYMTEAVKCTHVSDKKNVTFSFVFWRIANVWINYIFYHNWYGKFYLVFSSRDMLPTVPSKTQDIPHSFQSETSHGFFFFLHPWHQTAWPSFQLHCCLLIHVTSIYGPYQHGAITVLGIRYPVVNRIDKILLCSSLCREVFDCKF